MTQADIRRFKALKNQAGKGEKQKIVGLLLQS